MKVNGKELSFEREVTVKELLNELNLEEKKVVVEVNLEIVPIDKYRTFLLRENDSIEVLSFVGGG
ncbi:sulfur carrier protein ThiS [Clostridium cylindrosporum]|uniref:Thiamine biosynthesis protein ThiS n=1 Tax=Clostridium cylindrosporum DSM 605 TaxID=1121307 RepID=A0A0J8DAY4_CLOCY|nr:sulfur carrier protein ThiS [Clostridium cylindrosporum]KMT23220.1 hypothetical protein CLCY_6c01010 [Clostridium cylindrosporum DSM 605]